MRSTYKYLCYGIAGLVVLQAGFIAWGFFGVSDWITNDGGIIDKEYLECEGDCEMEFTAEWGFALHMFFVGTLLIPLTALVTLIVSFFSKVPGASKWAATIFGLVVLQVFVLPALGREIDPSLGALHGVNALVLFSVAYLAGRRVLVRDKADAAGTPVAA
jgi:hypothetical protein